MATKYGGEELLATRTWDPRHIAYAAETQYLQVTQAKVEVSDDRSRKIDCSCSVDGQVLQLKIHLGEFAPTGVLAQPLILFGDTEPINVRTDVDENEAWRVRETAYAVGYLRGNNEISTRLKFVRFEPYVIPKVSLTGEPTERVDTRVMQVIYSFESGGLPIKAGQQMDVYIDATPGQADSRALPR